MRLGASPPQLLGRGAIAHMDSRTPGDGIRLSYDDDYDVVMSCMDRINHQYKTRRGAYAHNPLCNTLAVAGWLGGVVVRASDL